jgi:hypothetical protein
MVCFDGFHRECYTNRATTESHHTTLLLVSHIATGPKTKIVTETVRNVHVRLGVYQSL